MRYLRVRRPSLLPNLDEVVLRTLQHADTLGCCSSATILVTLLSCTCCPVSILWHSSTSVSTLSWLPASASTIASGCGCSSASKSALSGAWRCSRHRFW